MAFDPDAFLAEKTPSAAFDPDAFLAGSGPKQSAKVAPRTWEGVKKAFPLADPALEVALTPLNAVESWKYENPKKATLSEFLRPLFQGAGGFTGGTLTSPSGPGALVGGGFGIAAGTEAANLTDVALGKPVAAPDGVSGVAKQTLQDIGMGLEQEGTGRAVGGILTPVISRLAAPFAKLMTPAKVEAAAVAEKLGIPLTPADATRSKALALLEQNFKYTPLAAGIMSRAQTAQADAVKAAGAKTLTNLGGDAEPALLGLNVQTPLKAAMEANATKTSDASKAISDHLTQAVKDSENATLSQFGPPVENLELGKGIQAPLTAARDAWQSESGKNFSQAANPNFSVPLNNAETAAKALLLRQNDFLQTKGFVSDLNKLVRQEPTVSPDVQTILDNPNVSEAIKKQLTSATATEVPSQPWIKAQDLRAELNKKIQNSLNSDGTANKVSSAYSALKKALDKDIAEAAGASSNPEVADKFKFAVDQYAKGAQTFKDPKLTRILNSKNPEQTVSTLTGPNNASTLARLQAALPPDAMTPIKRAYAQRVLNGDTIQPDTLSTIFSQTELASLKAHTDAVNQSAAILKAVESGSDADLRAAVSGLSGTPVETAANALTAARTEGAPLQDKLLQAAAKANPEQVPSLMSGRNAITSLQNLATASPDAALALKPIYAKSILTGPNGELLSPAKLATNLSKFEQSTLKAVFTPDELETIQDYVKASGLARGAEALAANTSGTAQALLTAQKLSQIAAIPAALAAKFSLHTALPAVGLVAEPLAAKAYLSPAANRYLTTGFQLPGNTEGLLSTIARQAAIQKTDNEKAEK